MNRERRWFGLAGALIFTLGLAVPAAWSQYLQNLGPIDLSPARQSTIVVDRDGRLLRAFTLPDGRWRLPLDLGEVDPRYVAMLLAYEDARFYRHDGVDWRAMARAALQLVERGRIVSGGSTLTMQVARLIEPREERSLAAKLRQAARAWQIERQVGKRGVLNRYLALAPFGSNLEGVRAASLAYFGKEPRRLTIGEAALLVALPQSPEARRPDRFADAARKARDRVLDRAVERGVVTPEEAEAAKREIVPSERRPFPLLAASAFTETALVGPDDEVRFVESRINLGAERGRVRRIAVREVDGRQVNLLAVSEWPAGRLIAIMRGRWRQENGFKHGVERWGINQLDRRKTVAYPPDTIIPNPARRRLDRALRAACIREGDARRLLALFADDDPRRARVEHDLHEATILQRQLLAERSATPHHAPLRDTELAGKLVRHDGGTKTVLDTVRIACVNVETDLANALAPLLPRAAEAKKTLANLFAAPGRVRVGLRTIAVDLAPAGTALEQAAFGQLLDTLNREKLSLPGDGRRRRLAFRAQIQ